MNKLAKSTAVNGVDRLCIVGAGGLGRQVLDIVEAVNRQAPRWNVLGFLDDGNVDTTLLDRREAAYLGSCSELAHLNSQFIFGIGNVDARSRLSTMFGPTFTSPTIIHPLASIGGDVELSEGVFMAAGSRVTTNVRIGRHSYLNLNAVVSHDCRIGDFVSISPGALINGNVTIGDRVFVGTRAIVLPGRTIGAGATVGAGAVVTKDVEPGTTVKGVPAK